ncbi:hypothetical protein FZ934_19850 (plasmid) [Rhizobium grahamii]|uniref:Uncharacterized protein n=1 Tax=Rhizobium grahamii TaxID=1120045 RepID=A0A5Q0CEU4_9HYPH|nr:hypothetical protein FZ934_19850 [Rhizobium grahamii]QRM52620.1 hypothetical protein F3Y33_25810 [Rhizobium sp. BG6]
MIKQRPKPPFSEDALQRTLLRVLRPLVRLCLASGLNYVAFSALMRRLFIDVAEKDFALPEKQQTDSRISLLTGIHRKDVSRLRAGSLSVDSLPAPASRTSRIVARWLADPRCCDETGALKALPRSSADGGFSFETLVGEVTKDLHARAVLDEWIDRGLAALDENDHVHLRVESLVSSADMQTRQHYFTRNLHDHAMAAVENILADAPPSFERAVHYNNISDALAKRLEAASREEAMAMLLRLNRLANQAIESDPGGDHRWIAGVYIFRADDDQVTSEAGE